MKTKREKELEAERETLVQQRGNIVLKRQDTAEQLDRAQTIAARVADVSDVDKAIAARAEAEKLQMTVRVYSNQLLQLEKRIGNAELAIRSEQSRLQGLDVDIQRATGEIRTIESHAIEARNQLDRVENALAGGRCKLASLIDERRVLVGDDLAEKVPAKR